MSDHHRQHCVGQGEPLGANGKEVCSGVGVTGVPSTDLQLHTLHNPFNLILAPGTKNERSNTRSNTCRETSSMIVILIKGLF